MTIDDILSKLYICACKQCNICKHAPRNDNCKDLFLKDLANDCKTYVEENEDDMK